MKWRFDRKVGPSFILPNNPWHNGLVEIFNGKLLDECLNRDWFRDRPRGTGCERGLAPVL